VCDGENGREIAKNCPGEVHSLFQGGPRETFARSRGADSYIKHNRGVSPPKILTPTHLQMGKKEFDTHRRGGEGVQGIKRVSPPSKNWQGKREGGGGPGEVKRETKQKIAVDPRAV